LVVQRLMQATASINLATGSLNQILQTTASLNTFTGSARIELNSIEAYTASLKIAAIVSSSTQIQNYNLFAQTSSANTFYGNQTISGSLFVTTTGISNATLLASSSNLILSSGSNLYIYNDGLASISGSVQVTGSIISTLGITGPINATNGVISSSAQLTALNTYTSSNDSVLARVLQTTASLNTYTGSNDSVISRVLQTTASINTTTGSMQAVVNQVLQTTASINTTTGSMQAVVNRILQTTASLNLNTGSYATTGSNTFIGTEIITGSLGITGSLNVGFSSGTSELQVLSTGVNIGNALTDRHLVTGSLNVTGSMTIRSGSITMPNRPAFRVVGTASTDRVAQTTLSGSYASIDYNEGNYYNNSTGIFTAPLTGLYNVYYNGRCGNVNSMQQVIVYKNGSTGTVQLMWEAPGNTGVAHFGVSGVFKLVAGDTLEAKVAVGSIQFDGNDTWGAAYIG